MRRFLSQNILLPLSDKIKRQYTANYFRQFKRMLRWPKEDVKIYQLNKLKKLIVHAYKNVPYYTRLFDNYNIKLDTIKQLEDLQNIPPLTRRLIQDNFEDLLDKKNYYRISSKGSSSGSTGQAVFYQHDEFGISAGIASHYLGWHLGGYNFGEKGLHIWGNPAVVKNVWSTKASKINSFLFRQHKYPAYQLTEEGKFDELIDIIYKNKYKFIDGYTNAIYLLAKHIERTGKQIQPLKYIFTTGENLHEYQKVIIERNLGKVFDEYGCGEILGIAYQNSFHSEYSIIDPHVFLEYETSIKGDDNCHPLIITDLDNQVMPLIRYMNGDLGVPSSITEKSPIPFNIMKSVSGRTSDIISLPGGGNLVVPSFFGSVLLKEVKSIRQYQIEKVSDNKLLLKFVVDDILSEEDEKTINTAMSDYLRGKINYEISIVDKIEVNPNGKFKLIVDKTN